MEVIVLQIMYLHNGMESSIYPVLLKSDMELLLVDCGYPGFLPLIEEAAGKKGFSLEALTGIIITHHDLDHMGSLFEFKNKFPGVKIYSSPGEEKYISGKEKSLRLVQAEEMFDSLPEEMKPGAVQFQEILKSMKHVDIDFTFPEDEEQEYFKGVKIVRTPGHMPGHISIYVPSSKTMIAADAVINDHGELDLANPQFTLDMKQAVQSLKRLLQFKIERLICYHGGMVENKIDEKLIAVVNKYESVGLQHPG